MRSEVHVLEAKIIEVNEEKSGGEKYILRTFQFLKLKAELLKIKDGTELEDRWIFLFLFLFVFLISSNFVVNKAHEDITTESFGNVRDQLSCDFSQPSHQVTVSRKEAHPLCRAVLCFCKPRSQAEWDSSGLFELFSFHTLCLRFRFEK